ncbi:hypothetical protein IWX50DRAFT_619645 [Phyllosticta citricarpa]
MRIWGPQSSSTCRSEAAPAVFVAERSMGHEDCVHNTTAAGTGAPAEPEGVYAACKHVRSPRLHIGGTKAAPPFSQVPLPTGSCFSIDARSPAPVVHFQILYGGSSSSSMYMTIAKVDVHQDRVLRLVRLSHLPKVIGARIYSSISHSGEPCSDARSSSSSAGLTYPESPHLAAENVWSFMIMQLLLQCQHCQRRIAQRGAELTRSNPRHNHRDGSFAQCLITSLASGPSRGVNLVVSTMRDLLRGISEVGPLDRGRRQQLFTPLTVRKSAPCPQRWDFGEMLTQIVETRQSGVNPPRNLKVPQRTGVNPTRTLRHVNDYSVLLPLPTASRSQGCCRDVVPDRGAAGKATEDPARTGSLLSLPLTSTLPLRPSRPTVRTKTHVAAQPYDSYAAGLLHPGIACTASCLCSALIKRGALQQSRGSF